MIAIKTERDILTQALDGIIQDTDITMVSSGSVAKAICGAVARPLADAYQTLNDVRKSSFLSTAAGFYLDLFGNSVGLPRRQAAQGEVAREDESIKFYVRSGRLAERFPHPTNLNLGRIPAGVRITNTDGTITYETDANYDFPASATETFVGATSRSSGISQNVGVGELRLLSNQVTGVLVTNLSEINSAGNAEQDSEYRFRLSKWVTSSRGANESAVRLAVLSVPGVADILQQEHFAGAGSFRIVLIPTGSRVPLNALRQAKSAVNAAKAYGIFCTVEEPRYIPFSIAVAITPRRGSLSIVGRDRVEAAIRAYVGNVRPGGTLVVNQLRNAILNSSDEVLDVDISSIEINRRPQVLTNYSLRQDEILVLDSEMTTPVLVQ